MFWVLLKLPQSWFSFDQLHKKHKFFSEVRLGFRLRHHSRYRVSEVSYIYRVELPGIIRICNSWCCFHQNSPLAHIQLFISGADLSAMSDSNRNWWYPGSIAHPSLWLGSGNRSIYVVTYNRQVWSALWTWKINILLQLWGYFKIPRESQ